MAKVKVHAGDFLPSIGQYACDALILMTEETKWLGEVIPMTELEVVNLASEDALKKIGGSVGWGVEPALVQSRIDYLARVSGIGIKNAATFIAKFKDGRKLLATTDSRTYTKIRTAILRCSSYDLSSQTRKTDSADRLYNSE